MARPYSADMSDVRFLASSLAALALAPPFGLWDLQRDLAPASRNAYGDVATKPRAALPSGVLVRCGSWCRLGDGWLAFRQPTALSAADVAKATAGFSKQLGWWVRLDLTPIGSRRWDVFAGWVRRRGLPDVLVVATRGQVAALPLASDVSGKNGVVTLTGFTRASAKALEDALRR